MPPCLKEAAKARHVSGVPLRSLHEVVHLNPGLPWRTQDLRDDRVMGYLSRRAANREWKQPKKKTCVVVSKAEWIWRSEVQFRHRAWRCRVWSLPSWFAILLWSSISALCSLSYIGSGEVYSAPLHVGSVSIQAFALVCSQGPGSIHHLPHPLLLCVSQSLCAHTISPA